MDSSLLWQESGNSEMADVNSNDLPPNRLIITDPAKWEEQAHYVLHNRVNRIRMAQGYRMPMKQYEFASCMPQFVNKSGFTAANKLTMRCDRMCNDIKLAKENQAVPILVRDGYWDEYEREYRLRLSGKDDAYKCDVVSSSLFKSCINCGQPDIDDPSFLLWLCERSLVPVVEVCERFLFLARTNIHSLERNEAERVVKMANRLCGWNVALSDEARSIALAHSHLFDFGVEEEEEEERMIQHYEAEFPMTHIELDRARRDYEFVHLLDYERMGREVDVDGIVERMGEIDRPENQLHLLFEWALRHRSAMGCTLAARIMKRWDLPSTRYYTLLFLLSTRPSTEKEKDGKRLIRVVSRLFLALSYEKLVDFDDVIRFYEENKENLEEDGKSYSLDELIANLPDIRSKQQFRMSLPIVNRYRDKMKMEKTWSNLVSLLNELFCSSSHSWNSPMDERQQKEVKEIIEELRSLSCRECHELAIRLGNSVMGVWKEEGEKRRSPYEKEPPRLFLPSRSTLLILCQVIDATIDSSLLPRFLLQFLPYLQSIARLSPHLAIHSSSVVLFLTARCFQSHLTFAAMGIWKKMRERVSDLVQSLCPLHWQTERIAKLFDVEMPRNLCRMEHGSVIDVFDSMSQIVGRVKEIANSLLNGDNWTEIKLISVADLLADLSTGIGGKRMEEWWRNTIIEKIKSGSHSNSMIRLLVLTVYRGMIETGEIVREMRKMMRDEDESAVSLAISVLSALLVGNGSSRDEEELMVEGSMEEGEEIGEMVETLGMLCEHSSLSIRQSASTMLGKLIKRQYAKRIVRGRMEGKGEGEEKMSREKAELYRQLVRKVSPSAWNGLDGEEGGKKTNILTSLTVFDVDSALREIRIVLEQAHSPVEEGRSAASAAAAATKTVDRVVAVIYKSTTGNVSTASLVHLLLTKLRTSMMMEINESISPAAYRNFVASLVVHFVEKLKRKDSQRRFLSPSTFLLPTLLFACIDVRKKIKDQLYEGVNRYLNEWRGVECTPVLLLTQLSVFLSIGREVKPEWISPLYEIIRRGIIGQHRNSDLFESVISLMERVERGGEKKDGRMEEKEEESEVMNMYLSGRSTSDILHFLRSSPRVERIPVYEEMRKKNRKRKGLRCTRQVSIPSEKWLERTEKVGKMWRNMFKAQTISGGLSFTMERRKRKFSQGLTRIDLDE